MVAAFIRGNVAVLIEISSRSTAKIDPLNTVPVAHQQYASLPAEGVPVSSGGVDVEWIVFWLCILAALAFGIVSCARRRGSWRGPLVAVAEAFGRRKVALGVSVLAVIGAMAFSMLDATVFKGFGEWFGVASYGDFWQNWADAAYTTFAGGYGHIYVLDRSLETAPALQVTIAPIARAAFGLSFPYPSAVLYPTAFWVAGPLYLGGMALPICACDRWLSGMGVTDLRRRLTVLGVMAITLPPVPLSGHPEDLIALGAMLYGIAAAFEDRPRATGWWLGVALAFQPFAFLAIPIAFIFLKRRQWLTALGPIVAVPLAFLIVPVVADPSVTLKQLFHQQVYDVFGYISPTWNLDPGVAAYIRSTVALVAIPAAIVLARYLPASRRQGAALVVWTVAMLFALRAFEPELFPYFLAPTLALAPISAARLPWWRLGSACALAVWLTWWLHIAIDAKWSLFLILAGQLCLLGCLTYPGRVRHSPTERAPSATQQTRLPTDRSDRVDGPLSSPIEGASRAHPFFHATEPRTRGGGGRGAAGWVLDQQRSSSTPGPPPGSLNVTPCNYARAWHDSPKQFCTSSPPWPDTPEGPTVPTCARSVNASPRLSRPTTRPPSVPRPPTSSRRANSWAW